MRFAFSRSLLTTYCGYSKSSKTSNRVSQDLNSVAKSLGVRPHSFRIVVGPMSPGTCWEGEFGPCVVLFGLLTHGVINYSRPGLLYSCGRFIGCQTPPRYPSIPSSTFIDSLPNEPFIVEISSHYKEYNTFLEVFTVLNRRVNAAHS